MSTLSQFAPGAVKTRQRGVAGTATLTVSAVDVAKSRLTMLGCSNNFIYINLTNSTTISAGGGSGSYSWELEEFY